MAWVFKPVKHRNGKTITATKWHVRYRDENDRKRVKVGYADKLSTMQLGTRLEREVAQRKEGIYVAGPDERSPTRLVPVYALYLKAKGNSPDYVKQTKNRLIRVFEATSDAIDAGCVAQALLQFQTIAKRRVSVAGINHYIRDVKGFGKWLVDFRGWPHNPLRKLKMNRSEAGRRIRRALDHKDFKKLIDKTAKASDIVCGLNGVDRSMLYLVAAYTGFRAKELESLSRASVGDHILSADAAHTKNKRKAVLPIPPAIFRRFTRWLTGRAKIGPLWPGQWRRGASGQGQTAAMIRADLAAAGIQYSTEEGVFDFHALRTQFVTELARAGVDLVYAQRLARHSDPKLTANIYSRLQLKDLHAAVAKLPGVG